MKPDRKVLTPAFFNRSALAVASELVGKYLVMKDSGRNIALMITESEAYDGESDLANHASRGRTKRTEVMYDVPGHFYVYLCYGMYWLLNVVTGAKDYPAAVLIRGLEGWPGPGKLTKALGIDQRFHSLPATTKTGLWFEDRGVRPAKILTLPRVGVSYAGPVWSKKKYRFKLPET